MKSIRNIKGVLMDSGMVINYPATGNWFITPRFFEIINEENFKKYSSRQIQKAINKSYEELNKIPLITNTEDEQKLFASFYRAFGEALSLLDIGEKKVQLLANEIVYNMDKYGYYKDAVKALPLLHKKYKTAVVSDAWPSLRNTYNETGLKNYVDSMVISSELGTLKPDKTMYLRALEDLNLSAEECVFVDDKVVNCTGAAQLGITPILMCRCRKDYYLYRLRYPKMIIVRDFDELTAVLDSK